MERLPLFISFGSLAAWALIVLFVSGKAEKLAQALGFGISLLQLGASCWAAVRVFSDSKAVEWSGHWFAVSATENFEIKFAVDHVAAVFWLSISACASLAAYFRLIHQLRDETPRSRGDAAALPILGIGALLVISSANLLPYYFGWSLLSFAALLAVGFSAAGDEERANAAFRFVLLSSLPEVIFCAGVIGCYAKLSVLDFGQINAAAVANPLPTWVVICLLLGTMLRSLQFPLMENSRHLASAGTSSYVVFFVGQLPLASMLFARLNPAIAATPSMQYLGFLPLLTALGAALLSLKERGSPMFIGRLASYLMAGVFLSGLAGDYKAAQALAFTGTAATVLLAYALSELREEETASAWFTAIAVIALTACPIMGFGWARFLEYEGLARIEGTPTSLHWLYLGLKLSADLIMGISLWGVLRERWLSRRSSSRSEKIRWKTVIPLSLLSIACFSVAIGGRPFGGLTGVSILELSPALGWFERLVLAPTVNGTILPSALENTGGDADILARILFAGSFLAVALLSSLWIFRDEKALNNFRKFAGRTTDQMSRASSQTVFWDWFLDPVRKYVGRAAAFFETRVVDPLFSDAWSRPAKAIRSGFEFVETNLIDKRVIDGLAQAVGTIGKSLRLIQNGQIQFYFALGLILTGAVIIKFLVLGG